MVEKKQRLRASSLLRREALLTSEASVWNRRIQERALQFPLYRNSRSIALYSPIGNEVATERIRDHALLAGKKLFYPKLGKEEDLALVQIESADELRPARYGVLEPTGRRIMTVRDQEDLLVFVPGVAFDARGNRLGRGKGWYDRVLGLLGPASRLVALAYEFQIVQEVPAETWDRRVHYVITESRIIDCREVLPHSR